MIKHTPTPWRTGKFYMSGGCSADHIYSNQSKEPSEGIARCYAWVGDQEAQANADFIVHACNVYEELVELLKRAERDLAKFQYPDPVQPSNEWVSETRRLALAAISKAEGK